MIHIVIPTVDINQKPSLSEEFSGVDLKDARLNRRCTELGETLGQKPSVPINQACEDWAETKAAYSLFQNDKVTPAGILASHQQQTVARMSQHDVVLAIQDSTYLNYTHHPKTKGLGPIGNKGSGQKGFLMHSTIGVTSTGLPLGVLTQKFIVRLEDEPSHKPHEVRKLPIAEKESYKWIEAFEQTINLTPADTKVITVCDRESDIYEMFTMAQEQKATLLVRAARDRLLTTGTSEGKLWAEATQAARAGDFTVNIEGNQKQSARQAEVSVRFTTVTFKPPWRPKHRQLLPVTLNAILVREENPAADIEDPIEWLLLTNEPVEDFDKAVEVIGWYCTRWQIENFHKVLKSGCTVEDCRLETASRLQNYIAMMSVVAWRLHWLTYINRTNPDASCLTALTEVEWQALYMRINHTTSLPDTPPTVRQVIHWIAQLGGFLGRRHDGQPGITTIWRGWQRLQDLAATWYLVKEQKTYG